MLKAECETQLRASCLSIPCGMRALGMTRQRGDSCLQSGIACRYVPMRQGPDKVASDVQSPHRHLACGQGYLHEEVRHVGQKPCERGRSNRGPHQPLDDGGMCGVKGMQIGVGFPCFQQSCPLPSPCRGPTDHLQGITWCPLTSSRRRRGRPSPCPCTTRATRWRVGRVAWMVWSDV